MLGQATRLVLHTGSTMVLARLLTPADFGLIAMVSAVTGFVGMFKDAGLSLATVQREQITHEQVSALFWINIALGLVVSLVTIALAPVVSWFYSEPRLTLITIALASTFVVGGATVQHEALLQRQMRFAALVAIQLLSLTAGIVTAIVIASIHQTYWALISMSISAALVNAVAVWLVCPWVPSLPKWTAGVAPMLKFGGGLTGFNVVNYFARNLDNVLIGWWWGPGPLGVYSKAYALLMLPLRQVNAPIVSTAMPLLSRLVSQPSRYRRAYLRIHQAICVITMPLVVVLIVLADLVVVLFLGSQWAAAAPIFAILGTAGLVQPANSVLGALYISQGRARDQFILGLINSSSTVAVFLLTVPYGIVALSTGYATLEILRAPFVWWWAGRKGPVRFRDLLTNAAFPLAVSLASGLILYAARVLSPTSSAWLNAGFGLAVVAALWFATFRGTRHGRAITADLRDLLRGLHE